MAENNEADPKIKASDSKGDSVAPIQDPMSFRDTDTGNLKRLTPGKAKKTIKLKPLTAKSSATKVPISKPDETQQGIGSQTSASDVKTATAVSQLVPNAAATGKQTIKLKTGAAGGEASKPAVLKPAGGLKPAAGKSAILKPGAGVAPKAPAPKAATPDSPTVNLTSAAKAAASPAEKPAPAAPASPKMPSPAAPKAAAPKPLTPKTGLTPVSPVTPASPKIPSPAAPKPAAPAAASPAAPKMPTPAAPAAAAPAAPKMPGLSLPKNALGDEEEAKKPAEEQEEDQFEKELKDIKSKKKKGKKQAAFDEEEKVEPGIILSLFSWAAMLFIGLAVALCAIQFANQWHKQKIQIPGLENIAEVKFFNKASTPSTPVAPKKQEAPKTEKKK